MLKAIRFLIVISLVVMPRFAAALETGEEQPDMSKLRDLAGLLYSDARRRQL